MIDDHVQVAVTVEAEAGQRKMQRGQQSNIVAGCLSLVAKQHRSRSPGTSSIFTPN